MDWHWRMKSTATAVNVLSLKQVTSVTMTMLAMPKYWSATAALFHNDVLADESKGFLKLDKGSFSWTHVCDGPTATQRWLGLGFELEQIADYTPDYALFGGEACNQES
ncbi:MAG: hypothetical protein CM15mV57_010 [uncultured marine virus]|nr:MAG: hypothetical protein CM15mV57_010 [uncultured marine virus]